MARGCGAKVQSDGNAGSSWGACLFLQNFRCQEGAKFGFFLEQFLERDPTKRLGCKPSGEGNRELRQHPWFKNMDWETLDAKDQVPPFTPDVCLSLFLGFWEKADTLFLL